MKKSVFTLRIQTFILAILLFGCSGVAFAFDESIDKLAADQTPVWLGTMDAEKADLVVRKRPQTPQPPFPYTVEDAV